MYEEDGSETYDFLLERHDKRVATKAKACLDKFGACIIILNNGVLVNNHASNRKINELYFDSRSPSIEGDELMLANLHQKVECLSRLHQKYIYDLLTEIFCNGFVFSKEDKQGVCNNYRLQLEAFSSQQFHGVEHTREIQKNFPFENTSSSLREEEEDDEIFNITLNDGCGNGRSVWYCEMDGYEDCGGRKLAFGVKSCPSLTISKRGVHCFEAWNGMEKITIQTLERRDNAKLMCWYPSYKQFDRCPSKKSLRRAFYSLRVCDSSFLLKEEHTVIENVFGWMWLYSTLLINPSLDVEVIRRRKDIPLEVKKQAIEVFFEKFPRQALFMGTREHKKADDPNPRSIIKKRRREGSPDFVFVGLKGKKKKRKKGRRIKFKLNV